MTTSQRTLLIVMAIVLAVATLTAAATAFAGEKRNKRFLITQQVAGSVHDVSRTMLQAKIRAIGDVRPQRSRPKPALYLVHSSSQIQVQR
jgi:hypothetical protein